MTKCPKCDAPLVLVADDHLVTQRRDWVLTARSFRILDLLGVTSLIALHFAAFRAEVTPPIAEWPTALNLTPTALTCLLHFRLRLRIGAAVVVHYLATILWTFAHSIGHFAALNAYNAANRNPANPYGEPIFSIYSNALNDALEIGFWAILFAFTYGVVCYTAIGANQLVDRSIIDAERYNRG